MKSLVLLVLGAPIAVADNDGGGGPKGGLKVLEEAAVAALPVDVVLPPRAAVRAVLVEAGQLPVGQQLGLAVGQEAVRLQRPLAVLAQRALHLLHGLRRAVLAARHG